MSQRILVPVDFSDCSREALRYAQELAARLGATIDILHVWYTPAYISPSVAIIMANGQTEALENIAKTQAEVQLTAFRESVPQREDVEINSRIEYGAEAEVIVRLAKDYDMIVMGTHGRSGVAHLFMGSVAEKVIRDAPCPVVSVRSPAGDS